MFWRSFFFVFLLVEKVPWGKIKSTVLVDKNIWIHLVTRLTKFILVYLWYRFSQWLYRDPRENWYSYSKFVPTCWISCQCKTVLYFYLNQNILLTFVIMWFDTIWKGWVWIDWPLLYCHWTSPPFRIPLVCNENDLSSCLK